MDRIVEILTNGGAWQPILFIIFQFLQVTFIPISSTPVTACGALLFPWWQCLIYTIIGQFCGSLFAFWLARRFGVKLVLKLIKKEQYDKITAKLNGREVSTLVFMFLFPVFPDDLLCLVAGLTKMKTRTFIIVQLLSRTTTTLWTIFGTVALKWLSIQDIAFYWWLIIGLIFGVFITTGIIYQDKISDRLLAIRKAYNDDKIFLRNTKQIDNRFIKNNMRSKKWILDNARRLKNATNKK